MLQLFVVAPFLFAQVYALSKELVVILKPLTIAIGKEIALHV